MDNLQEKIAKRAYELFMARGGEHGYHIADWLQAEKEIAKTPAAPVKVALKPAAVEKAAPAPAAAEKSKNVAVPVPKKKVAAKR